MEHLRYILKHNIHLPEPNFGQNEAEWHLRPFEKIIVFFWVENTKVKSFYLDYFDENVCRLHLLSIAVSFELLLPPERKGPVERVYFSQLIIR